jgi:hypothetical protein
VNSFLRTPDRCLGTIRIASLEKARQVRERNQVLTGTVKLLDQAFPEGLSITQANESPLLFRAV